MKVIYSYIVKFRRKMCATVLAGVRDRLLDETKNCRIYRAVAW